MPRTAKQRVSAPRRDLSAILDTPLPYARELQAKACGCAGCRRRRARTRTCKVCGYHGPFVVYPCICVSPEEIKARAFVLRELESAGAEESATLVRQRLAELLAGDRCPCGPGTECCHGCGLCPACAGGQDRWSDEANHQHPWRIIRALRRELARRAR